MCFVLLKRDAATWHPKPQWCQANCSTYIQTAYKETKKGISWVCLTLCKQKEKRKKLFGNKLFPWPRQRLHRGKISNNRSRLLMNTWSSLSVSTLMIGIKMRDKTVEWFFFFFYIANIKLLSAVLGPDNPFLCALELHSLPEEVGDKIRTKIDKKKAQVHGNNTTQRGQNYSLCFLPHGVKYNGSIQQPLK